MTNYSNEPDYYHSHRWLQCWVGICPLLLGIVMAKAHCNNETVLHLL
jgi:hypothetical protein